MGSRRSTDASVFRAVQSTGYTLCMPSSAEDSASLARWLADPVERRSVDCGPSGVRFRLETLDDRGQSLIPSDCPYVYPGVTALSRRAVERMGSYLQDCVRLVPMSVSGGEFWWADVVATAALDVVSSELHRFADGGISHAYRYALVDSEVRKIFRLSAIPLDFPLVTREFIGKWRANELVGLDFKPVWQGAK
jgi:hypothetical protein